MLACLTALPCLTDSPFVANELFRHVEQVSLYWEVLYRCMFHCMCIHRLHIIDMRQWLSLFTFVLEAGGGNERVKNSWRR